MTVPFFSFFTDSVLRGPTLGTMLMSLSAALTSVFVFVRRQSLVGETLSHAAYPGVVLATLLTALFSGLAMTGPLVLLGAFVFALLGFCSIHLLTRYLKINKDAALCAVLSSFFGIGVTLASFLQHSSPLAYRQIEAYLYGQAATMTDSHITLYGGLTSLILLTIILFYKELKCLCFDKNFAKTSGVVTAVIETLLLFLVCLSVIIGIRSVGVVLMAAMFIAPPTAARQWTDSFTKMFVLAAMFGMLSALLGVVFSTNLSSIGNAYSRVSLPTGPLIVLFAVGFAFFSLLCAPKRGLFLKIYRMARFRLNSGAENALKALWREEGQRGSDLRKKLDISPVMCLFLLNRLKSKALIVNPGGSIFLTNKGRERGEKMVRLHRLWELYLTSHVGMHAKNVHDEAEKIEHILSPELEAELTAVLGNPKVDPHNQPIPGGA